MHSYVTGEDLCIYDAPSPEAIRKAAQRNHLPVDRTTQVSVLDPYSEKIGDLENTVISAYQAPRRAYKPRQRASIGPGEQFRGAGATNHVQPHFRRARRTRTIQRLCQAGRAEPDGRTGDRVPTCRSLRSAPLPRQSLDRCSASIQGAGARRLGSIRCNAPCFQTKFGSSGMVWERLGGATPSPSLPTQTQVIIRMEY